jgi:hypothetical protein
MILEAKTAILNSGDFLPATRSRSSQESAPSTLPCSRTSGSAIRISLRSGRGEKTTSRCMR